MKKYFFLLICVFTLFAAQAQKSFTGTIVSKTGNKVVIKGDQVAAKPTTADSCTISKDLTDAPNPFGLKISGGWMGIGNAVFLSAKGDQYTFKITKEATNIVVNGKKKEQF